MEVVSSGYFDIGSTEDVFLQNSTHTPFEETTTSQLDYTIALKCVVVEACIGCLANGFVFFLLISDKHLRKCSSLFFIKFQIGFDFLACLILIISDTLKLVLNGDGDTMKRWGRRCMYIVHWGRTHLHGTQLCYHQSWCYCFRTVHEDRPLWETSGIFSKVCILYYCIMYSICVDTRLIEIILMIPHISPHSQISSLAQIHTMTQYKIPPPTHESFQNNRPFHVSSSHTRSNLQLSQSIPFQFLYSVVSNFLTVLSTTIKLLFFNALAHYTLPLCVHFLKLILCLLINCISSSGSRVFLGSINIQEE